MNLVVSAVYLLASYLMGSVPSGLLIVRLITGQDVRKIESGRTGGTNVARAAGFWAGLLTAIMDLLKAAVPVWVANGLFPNNAWMHILAPLAAILGHNYSIFLMERNPQGKIRLRGGAGGASCVGGSFGLWYPSFFIILPVAAVVLFIIGYASLATLSVALVSTLIFSYRAWIGASPWEYLLYGVFSFILLTWSLRPNIKRLIEGNERLIGIRARRQKEALDKQSNSGDENLNSTN